MRRADGSEQRRGVRGVAAGLLVLALVAVPGAAHAATSRTVSGKVTCTGGGAVVGIWVESSAGGSRWSDTLTRNKDYPNIASFRVSISTSSAQTTIRLDIGCGGTARSWRSNNSTPAFDVRGNKAVDAACKEKTGSRAQRCSLRRTTCATAGGIGHRLSATERRMAFSGIPTFRDGRGGQIEVSRSYEGSVSYQVAAGAEAEAGAVLAKAKASISTSISSTNSTKNTHTYRHDITAGKFGHAMYVSWAKRISYRKVQVNADCSASATLARGVIDFPTTSEGWYYWETQD